MKDVLIVGFGLAGLSIAKNLKDKNLSFDIISDQSQQSSKIAGGLINPIAVKRMKPVWMVEEFLPFAEKFYKELELTFNGSFYQGVNIKAVIHNIQQENNWYTSYDKPRIQPHLSKHIIKNDNPSISANSFGTINASLINLNELFKSAIQHYKINNKWIFNTFIYSDLKLFDDHLEYEGIPYKHVFFCEGFGVCKNPYFKNLGIYGNKGDYLIIESKHLKLVDILKAKYFLIPLGDDLYKFGATYQREPLNHRPSVEARKQMQEALDKIINSPYTIVDQVCGIRPTTRDRKPILGTHRIHKNLHIINGFGSRGVMTSPLLGKKLVEYVFEEKPLDKEVSIQRIYAQT